MARKRKKKQLSVLEEALLLINSTPDKIPDELINAEKVAERLTGKKLKPNKKLSYQLKATLRNCRTATTRIKRANTLLIKHYKTLLKLNKKISLLTIK